MKHLLIISLLFALLPISSCHDHHEHSNQQPALTAPKLVVGIVVDQMRYDYIYRFWDKYGEGGIKRIVDDGFFCRNANFSYMPTYTGPGHASIYTGTTPEVHGIIANYWYDRYNEATRYCAQDDSVKSVGAETYEGKMSPKNMLTSTLGDELRLASNFKGKSLGISLKDRGAILPGGHIANGAYWFSGGEIGKWISSTYYMEKLPDWVQQFNESGVADELLSEPWNTLLPIEDYVESLEDDNPYEGKFQEEESPVFPHDLPALRDSNSNYSLIKATPMGNTLTNKLAIASLDGESLGQDEFTDLLAISYSSTDYVGHKYGPHSIELQDTYLRLDQDLAELMKALDEKVGSGNYVLMLTADHGGVTVPAYLEDLGVPAGYFEPDTIISQLKTAIDTRFGKGGLVKNYSNFQVFLDRDKIHESKLDFGQVQKFAADYLLQFDGIDACFTRDGFSNSDFTEGIPWLLQNGFHQKRSGDLLMATSPGWVSYSRTGTTHGSPYSYDTHVPLIFYGWNIASGQTDEYVRIADIVPTFCMMLNIQFPNGTTGQPISSVLFAPKNCRKSHH